ncbi:MAG: UvrY/SirA/GacA family response regulator transcription factor [Gammaproteobacteria bacterium]|nr:UvrY/SirA/GacA family response regulator transcription factor [Gammaproteobacteria bacterium]
MIEVLVVDDHELVRAGIRSLLNTAEGISVIGEASSGEEAVQMARDLQPHVVLMDVRMPGIGGLEATRKLLRVSPRSKVIAVTALSEEPFPTKLLQAGATGYLTKDAGFHQMVEAIRTVRSGQTYLSPEVARRIAMKHLGQGDKSPWETLSEREMQVMLMITNGQKVQEISDKLCLSPKTVNSYRYRLFEKLGVHNDVELTRLAIRHGLIEDAEAG